jgi:hypothetical protein
MHEPLRWQQKAAWRPNDFTVSQWTFWLGAVRHCLRDEAKKVRPDARPQARKNRRCIRWNTNTLKIFFGTRTTQMVVDRPPVEGARSDGLLMFAYSSQSSLEQLGGLWRFEE